MGKPEKHRGPLASFVLEDLFQYAKARGLIDAGADLGARQRGRAGKAARNAVDQLLSLEYPSPINDGEPLTGKDLYLAFGEDYGIPFETVDKLSLDPQLVVSVIGRSFAEKRLILPLRREEKNVIIGVANPLDDDAVQTVSQLINSPVELRLILPAELLKIIREFYGLRQSLEKAGSAIVPSSSSSNLEQLLKVRSEKELEQSDQHVINAVEYLFRYAIEQRASDIHFEPKRVNGLVRMRIDGVMHTVNTVPMHVFRALISRVKTISRLDIAERRLPQDGRLKLSGDANEVEMRVSTLPVVFGEKVVLRLFDPTQVVDNFLALGFSPTQNDLMQGMLAHSHGMILVTGPTGSGKSTTLYCGLRQLAQQPVNIVSIEDPVEMILEDLNQVAVQSQINLGYAEVLRTILRQDPDIIMVGEIRDRDTARYSVQAALTGHLVLSTLHTNDAFTAIGRMLDLGIDRFFLAQVLRGLTAQRLVRRICEDCEVTMEMSDVDARNLGAAGVGDGWTITRGQGCDRCRHTGYRGRTTINEIISVTPEIAELIYENAPRKTLLALAAKNGYRNLRAAVLEAVLAGVTTPEEALRVVPAAYD